MKKKFLALLLCAGMFAEAAIPLSANAPSNIIVESDYGGTENSISVETDSEETSTLDFLVPVEQKTEVPEGYIGIYTAEDLDNVRNDLEANYILMNDIDLSAYENWEPIGGATKTFSYFSGVFDGNGFSIQNLRIEIPSTVYEDDEAVGVDVNYGLFSKIYGENAVVENLFIENVLLLAIKENNDGNLRAHIGAIAGTVSLATVSNCSITGNLEISDISSSQYSIGSTIGMCKGNLNAITAAMNITIATQRSSQECGGIVGCIQNSSSIENCVNYSKIFNNGGANELGGIIGQVWTWTDTIINISGCTNYGTIVDSDNCSYERSVGGIVGDTVVVNNSSFTIKNSSNHSSLHTTHAEVGGLIGQLNFFEVENSSVTVSECYNTGSITASNSNADVGGLIGHARSGQEFSNGTEYPIFANIKNCYNAGTLTCDSSVTNIKMGGIIGSLFSICGLELNSCYTLANITDNFTYRDWNYIGYVIGWSENSYYAVEDCYYEDTGIYSWEGEFVSGAIGKNLIYGYDSETLQKSETFEYFDFDTVWEIGVTEGYPYPTLRNNPHSGSNKPTPSENVLVGKTFTQSTLRALGYDTIPADYAVSEYPPFLQFTNENSGIFYIVNSEFGYPVNFTYTLAGDLITITPSDAGDYAEGRFGQATELVMQMTEDGNLKVKSYSPEPTDTNNYAIGWTTYDDIFLLKDIPSVKPTVSNMPSDYQINLGESFDLSNVTVTAGNGGKLNKVTLKHNLTGTTFVPSSILVAYQSSSITLGDNFVLSGDNYPLNTVGTHEFIIYASADNFIAADNQIATFTVTVTEPEVPFLVGNKYVQTTNTDKFDTFLFDAPYFMFNDTTSGKFYWNNPETGESGTDPFTYTISENTVILTAGRIYLGNVADEIVLNIIDEKHLEIAKIINYSSTEELSIGCTGVGDQFEVEIEQAKPSVAGLEKSYTVTQGDKLNLNFTVTAGNGANLNVVTLKNNAIKEPLYKETNISANSHTVKYTLSTDTLAVGTHTFVVYASADNYTVTDNSVATFTVTVSAKGAVSERITKDSPCTYENVFKAMCQILNDKNDGYNEYAKYEWEIECKDKIGWYTDEFLLLVMTTAWTESNWDHYESDGSVKIHGNSKDTGIMQLNTVDVITDDWLIESITNDWYYNLEYGMGNLWNAYGESKNTYSDATSCARGAYSRYNGGKKAGVTRWETSPIVQDNNFYKYYQIMCQWFAGNDGGATGNLYKAYQVFCKLHGSVIAPDPEIEQLETKITVNASLDRNIVKKGEKVTLTATITSIGKPLDKVTLQWYEHANLESWYPDDVYEYTISYEIDTNVYGSGTYRVYGAINGVTHSFDSVTLTVVSEDDEYTGQYYSMSIEGVTPQNNIYTVTNDCTIRIDFGTAITGGGIYLTKNGEKIGEDKWWSVGDNKIPVTTLDISNYPSGLYSIATYATLHNGQQLSGFAYEQIRIVHLPQIKVNNKVSDASKTISCNIENDIVFSSDWTNSNAVKCDVRWAYGSIGILEKSNNSVSISQNDIAGIALDTEFTAYCIVYFGDGIEYTVPIKLKLYESNINNKEIEENINSILEYKENAFAILDKLLSDGSITQSEYIQRITAINNAFEMATFAWYTDEDIYFYRYKNYTYLKDTIYYGLPYTQGYNFYNGGSYLNENGEVDYKTKSFYRYNDKNTAIANGGYSQSSDGYKLNAINQTTNKGTATTYVGNDCVAFSSIIWTGNGMPNGNANKNYGTLELAANAAGKDMYKKSQFWWEIDSTSKLRPGDILITTAKRHAVVFLYFEECANGTKRAVCIEQGGGTAIHNNISSYIAKNLYTVHVSSWNLNSLASYKYYIVSAYENQKSNKIDYCFRNGNLIECSTSDFNWKFGR